MKTFAPDDEIIKFERSNSAESLRIDRKNRRNLTVLRILVWKSSKPSCCHDIITKIQIVKSPVKRRMLLFQRNMMHGWQNTPEEVWWCGHWLQALPSVYPSKASKQNLQEIRFKAISVWFLLCSKNNEWISKKRKNHLRGHFKRLLLNNVDGETKWGFLVWLKSLARMFIRRWLLLLKRQVLLSRRKTLACVTDYGLKKRDYILSLQSWWDANRKTTWRPTRKFER